MVAPALGVAAAGVGGLAIGIVQTRGELMFGKLLAHDNKTVPISITDWSKMFRPGQQVSYGGRPTQGYQVMGGQSAPRRGLLRHELGRVRLRTNRILLFSGGPVPVPTPPVTAVPANCSDLADSRCSRNRGPATRTATCSPKPSSISLCGGTILRCSTNKDCSDSTRHEYRNPPKVSATPSPARSSGTNGSSHTRTSKIGTRSAIYQPEMVAHYMPYPDQANRFSAGPGSARVACPTSSPTLT